jgi:hypothetical protein
VSSYEVIDVAMPACIFVLLDRDYGIMVRLHPNKPAVLLANSQLERNVSFWKIISLPAKVLFLSSLFRSITRLLWVLK